MNDLITVIPDGDPFAVLVHLLSNYKAMGPLVIASASVTIIVQFIRRFLVDSRARKLVVLLLSIVAAILQKVISGMPWMDALVMAFFTMGGAVSLYEWFVKPVAKRGGN